MRTTVTTTTWVPPLPPPLRTPLNIFGRHNYEGNALQAMSSSIFIGSFLATTHYFYTLEKFSCLDNKIGGGWFMGINTPTRVNMVYGLPCGTISPHYQFSLKLVCLRFPIPSKPFTIFPIRWLIDKSIHCGFTSGMIKKIWFRHISNLYSTKFEIELGICQTIFLLPMLNTCKVNPSVNSRIVLGNVVIIRLMVLQRMPKVNVKNKARNYFDSVMNWGIGVK